MPAWSKHRPVPPTFSFVYLTSSRAFCLGFFRAECRPCFILASSNHYSRTGSQGRLLATFEQQHIFSHTKQDQFSPHSSPIPKFPKLRTSVRRPSSTVYPSSLLPINRARWPSGK
ncbi:hypothetical protein BDN72DRAFT_414781 [Pluteus cervinus]|uniref:Uncharacterized protein n=1 Tax=Pluteus cervinus TaxID=181527 RepID=A0ACD3B1H9_9AGAR|nr:hypothetical protein BDN72DRAFT_414781 [Pluteus cervinus]